MGTLNKDRSHTWDNDAKRDFIEWRHSESLESNLDNVCELIAVLEGYIRFGPIENTQPELVKRGDGKEVAMYGQTVASSMRLFVGVCEETNEIRTVILGPCEKQIATQLAKIRIRQWS